MSQTDAQRRATEKHHKEKTDEIRFRVPKGVKAVIAKHAENCGESTTKFIRRAIENQMKNDIEHEYCAQQK